MLLALLGCKCPVMVEDILRWNVTRKVEIKPRHFILVNVPVTEESIIWIEETLVGRYHLTIIYPDVTKVFLGSICPCFEDPEEALLYELRWA